MNNLIVFFAVLLMPFPAFACAGASSLVEGLGIYAVLFAPVYLAFLGFKAMLYRIPLKKPVKAGVFTAGILPLLGGIFLGAVFFTFYTSAPDAKASGLIWSGALLPMAAVLFAMAYALDKKFFAEEQAAAPQVKKYIIAVNLAGSVFLSFWIAMAGGSVQCSGGSAIGKLDAQSIKMDSISVFQ